MDFFPLNSAKSVQNRRCTSSMCVHTLCKSWKLLDRNFCSFKTTQTRYPLSVSDRQTTQTVSDRWINTRQSWVGSRFAFITGNAGKNELTIIYIVCRIAVCIASSIRILLIWVLVGIWVITLQLNKIILHKHMF